MSQTNSFNELQVRISNLPDDIINLLKCFGIYKLYDGDCFIYIGKINLENYKNLNKCLIRKTSKLYVYKSGTQQFNIYISETIRILVKIYENYIKYVIIRNRGLVSEIINITNRG